jgi:DNA-binding SARP family transcriptional activator/DNA-binding beta-propeller fold protein YncE
MGVEILVLGAVEANRNGDRVDLGPPQQRATIALLALHAEEVVPLDAIVDSLWPTDPPDSAAKIVQTYVSRLRKELGSDAIERRGRGYSLAGDVATDLGRFERLVAEGRRAAALAIWRGPALADLALLRSDAGRLDELRLQTIEEKAASDLRAGDAERTIPELRRLVADYPLREGLVALLMTALYASGRQAEALEAHREARARLLELGLAPGDKLRTLERRILEHDPSLLPSRGEQPDPASRPTGWSLRGRRLVGLIAVVSLVAASVVAAILAARGRSHAVSITPNSIVRIDPKTNRVVESIRVGRAPSGILVRGDIAWVANEGDRTLSRVDTRTHDQQTIGGLSGVGFLARDAVGNVYASGWDYPYVWRIDRKTNEVAERFRVRTRAVGLAVGGGFLFVVDRLANGVTSIDLARPRTLRFVRVGRDPIAATFGHGALWVANSDSGTVSVIRPGVLRSRTINVGPTPYGIAAGPNAIWVGSNDRSTVTRIEPDTGRVVKTIALAPDGVTTGLYAIATGAGAVWALNADTESINRIDPRTNTVVATIHVRGAEPRMLASDGNNIWVTLAMPGT